MGQSLARGKFCSILARFCLLSGNGKSTELGGWSPPKFRVLAEGGLCWLHIDSTSQ